MKYSFNLGNYYSKKYGGPELNGLLSLSPEELTEKLNSQIGALEGIEHLGTAFEGIFVAEVKEVHPHPDADKLKIVKIDDGEAALGLARDQNGLVQVVCGAPNVKPGMFVAWISPGAIVPSTAKDSEPFKLATIKLRGQTSNGMLASAKELGLGDDHSGILDVREYLGLSLTPTGFRQSAPLLNGEGASVLSSSEPGMWGELKNRSRENRKQSTKAEEALWQHLRASKLGVKFRRQHAIGYYIADFFAVELNLIIEVDGGYHNSADQQALDEVRTEDLEANGSTILRFTNQQIEQNLNDVLSQIKVTIKSLSLQERDRLDLRSSQGEAIKPGDLLSQVLELNDVIADFENKMFTHRPDCFGHLGIAREIAAIQGLKFKSPNWYLKNSHPELDSGSPSENRDTKLKVTVNSKACTKYRATIIEDVQVADSPSWMQTTFRNLGMTPINNLVDITNYMMILTAQPQHAFDLDKLKKLCGSNLTPSPSPDGEGGNNEVEIIVRQAEEGEELALLNGKTIKLNSADVVIATPNKAIALAGVMGGKETEVDENTKNILLETATFDMYAVRRTSMRHGLFTDAVTRYTKGQPTAQIDAIAAKTADEYKSLAHGKIGLSLSEGVKSQSAKTLHLSLENLNNVLGSNFKIEEVQEILERVEIQANRKQAKRVILIHGQDKNSQSYWYPWLGEQLYSKGIEFICPDMPSFNDPILSEWVEVISKLKPDQDTVIVGHSKGGLAVLHYLNQYDQIVDRVILVAANSDKPRNEEDKLNSFYQTKLNYNKISKQSNTFVQIHSTDDDFVPFSDGEYNVKMLNGSLVKYDGLEHFGSNLNRNRVVLNQIISEDQLEVTIPFWRTDLEIEEDIIEEVGRIHGFNQIPSQLQVRQIEPAYTNQNIKLKREIRSYLAKLGANETLNYSFVHGKLLDAANQNEELAFKIRNALSPDLQYYRLSLTPSLLNQIHKNIKDGFDQFCLFEIGKVHVRGHLDAHDDQVPAEFARLSLVVANKNGSAEDAYHQAGLYLKQLLAHLNIKFSLVRTDAEFFGDKIPVTAPFSHINSATIFIDEKPSGIIGTINSSTALKLKLPAASAGFEIDLHGLADLFNTDAAYQPLSKFPSVHQDITLEVPARSILSTVQHKLEKIISEYDLKFSLKPVSIYQADAKSSTKKITFSIEFSSTERTLTLAEINQVISAAIDQFDKSMNK
ncbi:MAG TPA: alpha/beta fold hydrolase [Candidatus Saccharibacteria bacterium]|nr:alpha/beta fold hydrolase [Candidatus Saccharibacteria bacterium]